MCHYSNFEIIFLQDTSFFQFLANCVENGKVERFNKILWAEVNCEN